MIAAIGVPSAFAIREQAEDWRILAWLDEDNQRAHAEFEEVIRELGGEDYLFAARIRVQWVSIDFEVLDADLIIERLREVRAEVAVLVSHHMVRAIQDQLPEVRLVVLSVLDPLEVGIINSFMVPGRNTTGVTSDNFDASKPLEAIFELRRAPKANVVVLAAAEWHTTTRQSRYVEAARPLGISIRFVSCDDAEQLARVIAIERASTPCWFVPESALIDTREKRREAVALVVSTGLPHLFGSLFACDDGAMLAMDSLPYLWYRPMAHALRLVIEGTDPSIIPFQRPTGWVYAVNETTWLSLGLQIPANIQMMLGNPMSRIGVTPL